ncbi:hypothetical protein DFH08DRAFT_798824 [Mycena albidolilacea]|uniref:Uncharacterized protein n=1 Tax=Mycena albidolilacea TaxID=1033008 RepID=A0AAD7APF9_9AGAR|nr:hypothetical protein DFH08DRAFT_798824 [Mycena albidolilacea]
MVVSVFKYTVGARPTTPSEHDLLENDKPPAPDKGMGKAPSVSPIKIFLQRPRSPSDEDSVPNKCRSRCKAKADDSDEDYTANADSEDRDELADDAEETGEAEELQEVSEDDEDEKREEQEACQSSPKKAVKGTAGGKAKAMPAATPAPPVSPLFAGPPLSVDAVQQLPVERVSHSLVTEAAKPPSLNKGPPACTNCISSSHDCQPAKSGHTNCCQRCQDGHMICLHGRTASELLTTFEHLCPVLAIAPSTLNMALISLVMARRELDLQWIQVTCLLVQYNQQMQELVDILLQQSDTFHTDFMHHFYEDETDHEVLQGILEHGLQSFTALSHHQNRYAWHPVSPC